MVKMAEVYAKLVIVGKRSIEDVPQNLQAEVKTILDSKNENNQPMVP